MHFKLFKKLLTCCLATAILVYITVHLILFDFPFDWRDEISTVTKSLLTATVFAALISAVIAMADIIDYIIKKRLLQQYKLLPVKKLAALMLLLVVIISACNAQPQTDGIIKDAATGLTATYKKIKPGKVLLVMNDEVIHHTDIPLGESFLLVNKGIKGLTVKNGKVAVGCNLLIKNKAGKIMLQSDDLFNGNDTFNKDSVNFLRCTVSTGKPMKWEEKYDVTVIFWDKYGSGKVENKVTIRCIDIP